MTQKTFTFTNERISSENRADGRQAVAVTPGGTKILASIVDGKITRYEAEDSMGNYPSLYSISQVIPPGGQLIDTGGRFCWVCVDDIGDNIFCYQVECPPFPPPDVLLGP